MAQQGLNCGPTRADNGAATTLARPGGSHDRAPRGHIEKVDVARATISPQGRLPAASLSARGPSAGWCRGDSHSARLGFIPRSRNGGHGRGVDALSLPQCEPFLSTPPGLRQPTGQGLFWGAPKGLLRKASKRRSALARTVAAALTSAGQDAPGAPGAQKTTRVLRILVSTGDVMGNIHAANLIRAIRAQFCAAQSRGQWGLAGAELQVYAIGSRLLEDSGAVLVASTEGLSSIGLLEAVPFILPAFSVLEAAKKFLVDFRPDALVLVDYPGINMRLGSIARQVLGSSLQIHYFIPPNEWLFWPWRARSVATLCDSVICTYGDEAAHFQAAGASVLLNGHPLADCCRSVPTRGEARRLLGAPEDATVVALVPASREQELRLVWPVLLTSAEMMLAEVGAAKGERSKGGQRALVFVIPVAEDKFMDQLSRDCEQSAIGPSTILCLVDQSGPHVGSRESHELGTVVASKSSKGPRAVTVESSLHALSAADVAVTKSGSVTLQLALLGVPQVVVYRLSAVTAFLARRVFGFNPEYVSLVNLMLGERAVPELLQEAATPAAVCREAMGLVEESTAAAADDAPTAGASAMQLQHYARLRKEIAGEKASYNPAAVHILALLTVAADKEG